MGAVQACLLYTSGKYLYNRCHLIGYQLSGENANEQNLITGTRYLNVEGMLPFENMVADYVQETGNHVLYRVTPIFQGTELVARGVQMEAESVEDQGEGICFNVYVYNDQPGITIDYEMCISDRSRAGGPEECKLQPGQFEAMCNPIAQAELLNSQDTQFNICLGLCVGHDSLFYQYSKALVTTDVYKRQNVSFAFVSYIFRRLDHIFQTGNGFGFPSGF